MALTHKIYESFKELPPEWNACVHPNLAMHVDELAISERAGLNHVQYYYVMTFEDEQLVLLSYYQQLHIYPEHFNCRDKIFQHHSLNLTLSVMKPSLLVVGNLFRHDAKYFHFVQKEFSTEQQASIYKQTFDMMLLHAKTTGIFLKDLPASFAACVEADESYRSMEEDVSMELNIPPTWTSIQDYEKMLKHKYVQRYKKIIKQQDGLVVRKLSLEDIELHASEIELLYLQVTNNQLVSMGKLNQSFFLELKKQLKDNYVVHGWFLEDRMVAFSSAILHDQVYDMNYIGFEYSINQSHAMYFNILFHCLEQAILTQSKKLILGRTALEAKAILGCEPAYQHSYYKLRNVVINWFYKKISAGFKEQIGEKWKDRHPFKSSYYTASLAEK
jgi:hypothetical protein